MLSLTFIGDLPKLVVSNRAGAAIRDRVYSLRRKIAIMKHRLSPVGDNKIACKPVRKLVPQLDAATMRLDEPAVASCKEALQVFGTPGRFGPLNESRVIVDQALIRCRARSARALECGSLPSSLG
jgi:hypothetical protein